VRPIPLTANCSAEKRSEVDVPSSPDAAEKIRDKLVTGRLPDVGGIAFTGVGTREICDGCDSAILSEELEYELEARDRRTFRFHVRCVLLWQVYGRQRDR